MSTTTVIDHLAVRWRPLAAGLRDQARFDRLSRALAGGPLDAAIDAGTDRDEIVCVRAVEVPTMRVTADVTDDELLGRLAAAIATAVGTAVADISDQAACIRYRSRAHAALDLAVSLARGDRRREWAWRQLGLWPGSGEPAAAGERIAVALAEAPGPLPGLLSAAAGADALGFLAGLLGPARLDAVVRAAWTARGRPLPGWDELLGSAAAPDDPDFAQVTTMLARGALGRELLRGAGLAPQSAAAASAAALLDAEPSLPLRPATRVLPLVTAAALVSLGRGRHHDRESGPAGSPWPGEGQAPAVPRPPANETAPQPVTAPQPGSTCPAAETTADPAVTPARGVATQYGGLPYLLHLVGQSGLPERVADGELASTGLVPFLYEIGLRILSRLTDPGQIDDREDAALARPDQAPDREDAALARPGQGPDREDAALAGSGQGPDRENAALARPGQGPDREDAALACWCGRAPEARWPDGLGADHPSPRLSQAADAETERLIAALRAAIEPSDLASAPEPDLLAAVCRRSGRIVADPGWIDVHLDLAEVSTDVRRAGLDLDPGYLPWLGCVVRFVYG